MSSAFLCDDVTSRNPEKRQWRVENETEEEFLRTEFSCGRIVFNRAELSPLLCQFWTRNTRVISSKLTQFCSGNENVSHYETMPYTIFWDWRCILKRPGQIRKWRNSSGCREGAGADELVIGVEDTRIRVN